MTEFSEIWSYLSQGPLLWLTATLAAYGVGDACFRAAGRNPLVNPVLIAVAVLAAVLWLTGTPYPTYFEGAQFVHFLLGPATVALALPLCDSLPRLRRAALPVLAALLAGSLTAAFSAVGIAWALGVDPGILASLAPKSATAPVAIGISEGIGGSPTLTAVLVILTGITGRWWRPRCSICWACRTGGRGALRWASPAMASGPRAHFRCIPPPGPLQGLGWR